MNLYGELRNLKELPGHLLCQELGKRLFQIYFGQFISGFFVMRNEPVCFRTSFGYEKWWLKKIWWAEFLCLVFEAI